MNKSWKANLAVIGWTSVLGTDHWYDLCHSLLPCQWGRPHGLSATAPDRPVCRQGGQLRTMNIHIYQPWEKLWGCSMLHWTFINCYIRQCHHI